MTALHRQIREAGRKFKLVETGTKEEVASLLRDESPYVRMLAGERIKKWKENPSKIVCTPTKRQIDYVTARQIAEKINLPTKAVYQRAMRLGIHGEYGSQKYSKEQAKQIISNTPKIGDVPKMFTLDEALVYTGKTYYLFIKFVHKYHIEHKRYRNRYYYSKKDIKKLIALEK